MAKLNRLIKGQDLAFDTHQAGDGQPVNWKDLHMEKRLHGGRGKLRFPLFGGQNPKKPRNMNSEDYESTIREVKAALKKNADLVEKLSETITEKMKKFSSQDVTAEQVREAANKIASAFDLDESFIENVVSKFGRLTEYSSYHLDKKDFLLYQVSISSKATEVKAARLRLNKMKRH
jgi:hypothetical protein